MNIFILDYDTKLAAQYHCDKHIVKMITETCQLLSTYAHYNKELFTDDEFKSFYKKTHVNHPCNIWLRESINNVAWLNDFLGELINEYFFRFGKQDNFLSAKKIHANLSFNSHVLLAYPEKRTKFALAMPNQYKTSNAVESYRAYYQFEKARMAKYTRREKPTWLNL